MIQPPLHATLLRLFLPVTVLCLSTAAGAMVGGAPPATEGIARAIVTIVGSRGNVCSGAMIGRDLVLTAAHCVRPGAQYKVVDADARPARLLDVASVEVHPQFSQEALLNSRATADVALLRMAAPLPASRQAAALGVPVTPIRVGAPFFVAGSGVTSASGGDVGGPVRAARLVTTGQPGTLQIRLVDPGGGGKQAGLGACTGDSGGPAFEDQNGRAVIVGVISWSTGPNLTAGCGGMTGVTPLSRYRDWIVQTARRLGVSLPP